MKRSSLIKSILPVALFLLIIFQVFDAYNYTNTPPSAYTGAPNESNCTGCHSGSYNTGSSLIQLSNGTSNLDYIPGKTYNMKISFTRSGHSKFGFEATALIASTNKKAGYLKATNSFVQKDTSTGLQRSYIEHSKSGTTGTGGSITWSFDWTAPSSNVGDINFYVIVNSTNNNNSDKGDTIYQQKFTITAASTGPIAKFNYSPKTPCVGDTVTFTDASTGSPTSLDWTIKGCSPSQTTATGTPVKVVFGSSGSASVKLKATNSGGSSYDSQTVVIAALPGDSIIASKSTSICKGDTLTLFAPLGLTYLWNNGLKTRSISVKDSGSYSVKVSNGGNCFTNSKPIQISYLPVPFVTLKSDKDTLCAGATLTLTASGTFNNYKFYYNGTLMQSSVSNVYTTSSISKSNYFYVVATSGSGCVSDSSNHVSALIITPLGTPQVGCDSSTTSSIQVKWQSVSGATGYEVSTDSGKTWKSPSSGSTGLVHKTTGLGYGEQLNTLVRAIDNSPCGHGQEGNVVCATKGCLTLNYNLDYDSVICLGQSSTITLSNLGLKNYSISLNGQTPTTDTVFVVKPPSTATLTLSIVDSNTKTCPPSIIKIKVRVTPAPTITLSPNKSGFIFCSGDSIKVTASTGFSSYSFFVNDTLKQNTTSNIFKGLGLKNLDKIRVVAVNGGNCPATAGPNTVKIYDAPNIGFTRSLSGFIATYDDTTSNVYSRSWLSSDGGFSLQKSFVHDFKKPGTYSVRLKVSNSSGCSSTLYDTIIINPVGIESTNEFLNLSLSPNPTSGNSHLEFTSDKDCHVILSIVNLNGKVINKFPTVVKTGVNRVEIPSSQLSSGVYFMKLIGMQSVVNCKLVKE